MGTIITARQTSIDYDKLLKNHGGDILSAYGNRSLNDLVTVDGYVSLAHLGGRTPPEHLEGATAKAFQEDSTCESMGCYNAAAAMYRASIDLLTKPMLPPDGEPNAFTRKNLGERLKWLFANGVLPADLQDQATAVHLDGNDGVHDVSLSEADAADLGDFTELILERTVTIPAKIKAAAERRTERRNK